MSGNQLFTSPHLLLIASVPARRLISKKPQWSSNNSNINVRIANQTTQPLASNPQTCDAACEHFHPHSFPFRHRRRTCSHLTTPSTTQPLGLLPSSRLPYVYFPCHCYCCFPHSPSESVAWIPNSQPWCSLINYFLTHCSFTWLVPFCHASIRVSWPDSSRQRLTSLRAGEWWVGWAGKGSVVIGAIERK